MDLDTLGLQPGQREAIEHAGRKLFISAGAGTGKTHTLTQKIAWMFSQQSGAKLREMGDLLAITFTNAAASELVGRVRSVLRVEGMSEKSMQIDSAWISTIHGMCSRILRDYAIELGIDPAFQIVTEQAGTELMSLAIEDALDMVEDDEFVALFEKYPMRGYSKSRAAVNVYDMVVNLIDLMATAPEDAVECLHMGPAPQPPDAIANMVAGVLEASLAVYDAQDADGSWMHHEARAAYVQAIGGLRAVGQAQPSQQPALLEQMLEAVPAANMRRNPWKSDEGKQCACAERQAVADAHEIIKQDHLRRFVDFAQLVRRAYDQRKRLAGYLDNGDLLAKMHTALREFPQIRQRYSQQFKLIMVDEFQDTDWLQFDSIDMLLGDDAQRCTVGDAQQSIYRFRGADVSLFTSTGAQSDVHVTRLDVNFRSHPAVLGFVNDVFRQPFGATFLKLNAPQGYRERFYPPDIPRIELLLSTYAHGSGVTAGHRRAFEAAAIASRFGQIRDAHEAAGQQAPKMVVLLGSMANSDIYADALRAQGFDAVVTGGSGFWDSPETAAIADVLRVLANPLDDEALLRVLLGPVFAITPDDVATLSLVPVHDAQQGGSDDVSEHPRFERRCLWDGLRAVARSRAVQVGVHPSVESGGRGAADGSDRGQGQRPQEAPGGREDRASQQQAEASDECAFAAQVLVDACQRAVTLRVDEVLTHLFADSGWAARLAGDADGRASAANVLKAIRIVKTIVDDPAYGGCGDAATTSRSFNQLCASGASKESPGSLTGSDADVVELMTIHASKGLQFPVVAVAEFSGTRAPQGFLSEVNANERWIGFALKGADPDELGDTTFAEALACCDDYPDYARKLTALIAREDTREQWRKFYVAATRAEQALIVAFSECITKKRGRVPASPLVEGILAPFGLLDDQGLMPLADAGFTTDSGHTGRLWHLELAADDQGGVACVSHPEIEVKAAPARSQALVVPQRAERGQLPLRACTGPMMSYSKMARLLPSREPDDAAADRIAGAVVDGADYAATDLGSAYHRVMEYLIESGAYEGDGSAVMMPPRQRIDQLVAEFALGDEGRRRLDEALGNWQAEVDAGLLDGWFGLRAEVPFCTVFAQPGQAGAAEADRWYLTGSIDALAQDGRGGMLIVDYKTGYPDGASNQQMQADHRMQAMVYADAVFSGNPAVRTVEAVFVRVEHPDDEGRLDKARFGFSREAGDDVVLHEQLLHTMRQARAKEA